MVLIFDYFNQTVVGRDGSMQLSSESVDLGFVVETHEGSEDAQGKQKMGRRKAGNSLFRVGRVGGV